ncbi:hypothetical protein BDZ89DRAFT_1115966 [Hymenopellis radicata]|nr:hypothetical protein BDZ89DRAFT_1115966 [Hymenopellis radicata]
MATSSPATVAHGPMFIGLMFNFILLGIIMTQLYIYLKTYKRRDKLWMKVFVFVLLIANLANSVFIGVDLYLALINHFDDVKYLQNATWLFATDPALTGLISGGVQLFFAWRVKVLTSNWYLTTVVVATSMAGTVAGIAVAVEIRTTPAFVQFQQFQSVVIVWLVSSCVADLCITGILVWYLRRHKTGFQGSDELVDRIIRLTIQTGLVTSICAIIDLIMFLLNPAGLHLIFNFPLCKLYTTTLMSSLNSRSGWSYSHSNPDSNSRSGNVTTMGGASASRKRSGGRTGTATVTRPEVFVHVEQHELGDRPRFTIENADLTRSQAKVDDNDDGTSSVWDGQKTRDEILMYKELRTLITKRILQTKLSN